MKGRIVFGKAQRFGYWSDTNWLGIMAISPKTSSTDAGLMVWLALPTVWVSFYKLFLVKIS